MSSRPLFVHAILALLALLLLSCNRPAPKPRNVLIVSLDTVRADRIGCYGRANADTPNLDALAARGARFADATAPAPLTLPSHASLLTGLDVERHRVRHNGLFALSPDATTLAEILRPAGLRTGAFVASAVLAPRQGLDHGFERYGFPEAAGDAGLFFLSDRPATEVNAEFLAWQQQAPAAPFFAFLHYMEAHSPYEPPEPARSAHLDDPYQGEIATLDRALGELFAQLKSRGALDDTVIIIVADHGEDLGDHGEGTHGIFVYQSTLHVPFIVAGPGVKASLALEEPVALVDVMPTVLTALGLPAQAPCDGVDLWPALSAGKALDAKRELVAETFVPRYDYGWSELRAPRSGSTKLIEAPRPELYELSSDPGERKDLAATDAQRVLALRGALGEFIGRVGHEGLQPTSTNLSADEREALGSLGYLSGAHSGTDSSGPLPDPKDHVRLAVALDQAGAQLREGNPVVAEALLEGQQVIHATANLPNGERVAATVHVMMGRIYFERKQLVEAAREWEKALVVPQPPLLRLMLAETYRDLGQRAQAVLLLRQGVTAGQSSPEIEALLKQLDSVR